MPRGEKSDKAYKNPDNDSRGPWKSGDYTANKTKNERPNLWYPIRRPSDGAEIWPASSSTWRYSQETHARNEKEGRVWWGSDGKNSTPAYKRFLSEVPPVAPATIWLHEYVGHTDEAKKEIKALFPDMDPFATPKPERLMERIIHIGSDPGEVVLDCFAGSGTTAAVAHKMGRRWVAVEWSKDTLRDFLVPRLTKVVNGEDPGGITASVGWEGGGGFRILDVAPSMFEADEGMVFLAEWATDNALGEATAAQLRFEYEPDSPFCGRKGRQRLAVLDGIATPEILDLLVSSLGEGEKLVLCATAIAPDAQEHLKMISSGSRIRKIPASILAEYRVAYRARRRSELNLEVTDADPRGQISEAATS